MKKLFNILLVAVLTMVSIVPTVFAISGTSPATKGTITVTAQEGQDQIKDGEVYKAYRILDLESFNTDKGAYAYKASTKWNTFVNSNNIKGVYLNIDEKGYVTWVENADVAVFAKLAYQYAKENNIAEDYTATAKDGSAVFSNVELGYYLVNSSLGVTCSLNTTNPNVIINEKNQKPGVDKEMDEGKTNDKQIGDSVNYTITANNVAGLKNVVITDKLSVGLTLQNPVVEGKNTGIVVKNGSYTLVEGTDYTVSISKGTDNSTVVVINILDSYTTGNDKMQPTDVITVEYTAKINENSITNIPNTNDVEIKYGNGTTVEGTPTTTYTYGFKFYKTDEEHVPLTGAEFKLYDAKTAGNEIPVVLVKTETEEDGTVVNYYRVATSTETGVVMQAGKVVVDGLANGTYYLEETKAPEGFNKLAERIAITIDKENDGATFTYPNQEVINTTGAQLPSTGGMGTIIFITIGSMMVLGFGVMLIAKFRMSKINA